jgi:protein-L-isoaspartate(D-aspartate) O-methyltransferase
VVRARLEQLGITNVVLRVGDGVHIFRDQAPFNAILSAAAPLQVPDELLEQLADGGRMIIPIGSADLQFLWLFERQGKEIKRRQLDPVRFVPLRSGP